MSVDQKILNELRAMCEKAVNDYRATGTASEEGNKVQIYFDQGNEQFIVTLLVGANERMHFGPMGFKFINPKATVDEMMEWIQENLHPVHFQ